VPNAAMAPHLWLLDGRLNFLAGSRRLAALRDEVDVASSDADFATFIAIESCTDALARLEPEIQSAQAWAAGVGSDACRSLIAQFGESPSTGQV